MRLVNYKPQHQSGSRCPRSPRKSKCVNSDGPGLEVILGRCVWCRESKGNVGKDEVIIRVANLKHITFYICFLNAFAFTTHMPHKAFHKLRTI